MREETLDWAYIFLACRAGEPTPEQRAKAERDAFVEVLFFTLLRMPDEPGQLTRAEVWEAHRMFWQGSRWSSWNEYGWERLLLAALRSAGDPESMEDDD